VPTRKGSWNFAVLVTDNLRRTGAGSVAIQVQGPIPSFTAASLVNAASFQNGIAPGAYVSVFGVNLAESTETAQQLPLPRRLGNTVLLWNGTPVPLLVATDTQINAQVPFTAAAGRAEMQIVSDGVASASVPVDVQAAAPGLFQAAPGFVLAINEDGTLNSSDRPASAGSIVTLYATGCGAYDASVGTGDAVPVDRLYRVTAPVTATVGSRSAEVPFVGAAPGQGSGLVQVNLKIPDLEAGEWPMQLTVGGVNSNAPHIFTKGR
jgi:uncharacterized protein (TIGR03437 family)